MNRIGGILSRSLLGVLLAVVLVLGISVPAFAATTQDVTVTALPTFLSISNAPSSYAFGAVAASGTPATTQGYFTITNGSSVNTDIAIASTSANWTGGVGWVHSDTATAAADTAGLKCSNNTNIFGTFVRAAAPEKIESNIPATKNPAWELKLYAPTSFADGALKTQVVRLTVTASP
jgi:hypothetical protein